MKKTVSSYTVRDAIEHKDLGTMTDDIIKVTVRNHAVKVYILQFTGAEEIKNLQEQ